MKTCFKRTKLFLIMMVVTTATLHCVTNLEKAKNHFANGCELLNTQKYSDALNEFNISISLDPSVPNFWERRGTVHFSMQNYAAAIVDYTYAINLCPQVGFLYMERALSYQAIGNINAARNDVIIAANLGDQEAQRILAAWIAAEQAAEAARQANLHQDISASIHERFGIRL